MPELDPCRDSAQSLARALRAGAISSLELVEAHMERIRRANPAMNAMVRERFSAARAEARAVDAAMGGGEDLPPLAGLPCSIKECFALRGMPQTSGLVARRGWLAHEDAPAVARLRAAGAIPLGVTNVSELCMWMESANKLYGRTGNPYNPDRIVGGSSGGEAAVVAAGGAVFGLGSDVGGSIRMPAFFNGMLEAAGDAEHRRHRFSNSVAAARRQWTPPRGTSSPCGARCGCPARRASSRCRCRSADSACLPAQ